MPQPRAFADAGQNLIDGRQFGGMKRTSPVEAQDKLRREPRAEEQAQTARDQRLEDALRTSQNPTAGGEQRHHAAQQQQGLRSVSTLVPALLLFVQRSRHAFLDGLPAWSIPALQLQERPVLNSNTTSRVTIPKTLTSDLHVGDRPPLRQP